MRFHASQEPGIHLQPQCMTLVPATTPRTLLQAEASDCNFQWPPHQAGSSLHTQRVRQHNFAGDVARVWSSEQTSAPDAGSVWPRLMKCDLPAGRG
jgi:hypothetical protein